MSAFTAAASSVAAISVALGHYDGIGSLLMAFGSLAARSAAACLVAHFSLAVRFLGASTTAGTSAEPLQLQPVRSKPAQPQPAQQPLLFIPPAQPAQLAQPVQPRGGASSSAAQLLRQRPS